MISFTKILLVALSATNALATTATDVYNDLVSADKIVIQLNNQVNAYTGTGAQLVALQQTVNNLITAINKTTTDTKNTTSVSQSDAQKILNYVSGTPLYNDTQKGTQAIISKKSLLVSRGAESAVKMDLQSLKGATDTLANALIAKAPTASLKSTGSSTKAKYDALYQQSINDFSS